MHNGPPESHKRLGIGGLVLFQLAVLWMSFDWLEISPFCTVTESPEWKWVGFVHLLFLALLALGTASIFWRGGRIWYVALLCFGFGILLLQASLVDQSILTCDGF